MLIDSASLLTKAQMRMERRKVEVKSDEERGEKREVRLEEDRGTQGSEKFQT